MMESTDTTRDSGTPGLSLVRRLGRINRLFLITVVVPTVLAILYYGLYASDVYLSESRFVVRSPQRQQAGGLGSFLQGVGFSRAQDDSFTVHDYMLSRDALRQLDRQIGMLSSYGNSSVDLFSRFAGLDRDTSFEALHRYYRTRVQIRHDGNSSITTLTVKAFSPEVAQNVNAALLDMAEKLVNQLNERGRQDMIRFASQEVAQAESKATAAALALSRYRNSKGLFDPERQSLLQLQQISKLQDELIATKAQLAQLRAAASNNPQISSLTRRVEFLQAEIAAETAKVAGGRRSLTDADAEYERLVLERSFADKQLAGAMASLEQARNEAQRKQLYLERIVQPGRPDKAVEPRRIRAVLTTLALGLIAWGILSILIAGVREHTN